MWARIILAGALVAGSATADPIRLSLPETVRRAEQSAPALGPSRAAMAGSREVSRAADSALTTPPRVELEVGPRWRGSSRDLGLDATVGAWQDLPLGGVGSARRRFAAHAGAEAQARWTVTRHDVQERAALAWIDARLARELTRIRQESLTHAQSILRVAAARVRAGSAPPGEESVAKATVGRARAELIEARGRVFVADADLRFMTGLAPGTAVDAIGRLDASDKPLAVAPLIAAARASQPDVTLAELTAESRARSAELAWASGKPHLSVGPSVTHESTGDWILLARVAFPLPVVNPARLEGARARVEADVARAQARYARAAVQRDLILALEERKHAREMRDELRDSAVGPAREALRQSMSQYEAGSGDSAPVLGARRELLAAEERWAEAAADVRRADVRLARLLGRRAGELSGEER